MSLFDRLVDHITPLTLIYLLGAAAAAGWLGIAVMLLRDHLADAWHWARRRWHRAHDDDAFADDACALTQPAPDPTPLPADFRMWARELTEPGRRD